MSSTYRPLTMLRRTSKMMGKGQFWGRPRSFGAALVLGAAIFASNAHGQDGLDAGADEGETAVAPLTDQTPADNALTFGNVDPTKVPLEEKKTRVESMLVDQRDTLGRVVTILAEARSSKDIVQLNCVNEKLTQIKGLLKISEQASLQMYDSIASGTQDLVNHEFTKIVVAHQKSQVLRAEAEQCVGENSVYAGDTSVDVEIESQDSGGGGFGADPTTAAAAPPGPTVPPVASTFL